MSMHPSYIRYQSPEVNERGICPGIFALANRLGRDGSLTEQDHDWWLTANRWCDEIYPDPSTTDWTVYDRTINPGAQAWFKCSADHLLQKADEYLLLLARYDVDCHRVVSDNPGRLIYEDQVQVVVSPWSGASR